MNQNNEIGSGSVRNPTPVLGSFYDAIKYTEESLAAGVPAAEIEKNLLTLYTPVARQEYGTRRHQMTFVAVVVAAQALKVAETLKDRIVALEAKVLALTPAKTVKLRDQLKAPRRMAQARKPARKAKAKVKARKTPNRRQPAYY